MTTRRSHLPIISLLTDFGTTDYFVGAVKGAILSVNPSAVITDITHEVPPQDIDTGAFTLFAAYQAFPAGTIHVAVVDPGVGSARRAIVVKADNHLFVGPDNGLFTYIYDRATSHRTYHVTAEKYFRRPVSSTFHGRDIFAPVAAALSNGVKPEAFGPAIRDEVRLGSLSPLVREDGVVEGRIIHVDRFGNCITNITREFVKDEQRVRLLVKRKVISTFRSFYSGASDAPFAIWGSAGLLEISITNGSAAEALRLKRGDAVVVRTSHK